MLPISKRGPAALASALFLAIAGSTAARAYYGPALVTTVISADSFRPRISTTPYSVGLDGYLYAPGAGPLVSFEADLRLPNGAEIKQVCMFSKNATANFGESWMSLNFTTLATQGDPTPIYSTPILLTNHDVVGYDISCSEVSSFGVYQPLLDVNEGAGEEYIAWRIWADVPSNDATGFGGALIGWQRTVSPPTQTSYLDVPSGTALHPFVEALRAAGVTAGCTADRYCPDAPMTRGQAAVFLAKALGLHWPD